MTDKIDESLYSRQLYVFGKDAMEQMKKSNVLISGINGLGLEVAKCVILSGVKSVVLHDTDTVEINHYTTHYYLNKKDMGTNIADASVDKLSELNPYVSVSSYTGKLTNEILKSKDISVVVLCDNFINDSININKFCRNNNIRFIMASTIGLMGFVFCDFGDSFVVNDKDGEQIKTGTLIAVEKGAFVSDKLHELNLNDKIEICCDSKKSIRTVTKIVDKYRFTTNIIEKDSTLANTTFSEIKQPITIKFKSLKESIDNPEIMFTDMCDPDRPRTLHSFNIAYSEFVDTYERAPGQWSNAEAELLLKLAGPDVDKDVIKKLSHTAKGYLCPMASIIGSIAAQEVMKASSGKFMPIKQWFYFDALSLYPEKVTKDIKSSGDFERYKKQIVIFGNEFQKKLAKSKIFIVGSGAIGCEHLKNFSMMGIGNIVITDMDTIEKSNLSRQFLFRNSDIGKFKSETAAKATKVMNPLINIEYHTAKVSKETSSTYNKEFFDGITCVANALDNIQARLFMDQLCVQYAKPLLESGTLGTKGNVQAIIPFMTENYGAQSDQAEQSIPVCTLKNFPYQIEHTIQYARDQFEGYYTKAPANYNKYCENPDYYKYQAGQLDKEIKIDTPMTVVELAETYEDVKMLNENRCNTKEDCVKFAYKIWHQLFRDQIQVLIKKFPVDLKNDDGTPFWSGTKRCPSVAVFDISNKTHVGYVNSMANLWAKVFGIGKINTDRTKEILGKLTPPEFSIDLKTDDISANDEEEKKKKEDKKTDSSIIGKFPDITSKRKLQVIEFEKDDDTNYHIDFITHSSNMRALNYGIKTADKFKTKGIAGKIIPAIATTTSLVSGLVALEVYKIVAGYSQIEKYRNSYINLAMPFFGFTEPSPAKKLKIGDLKFTVWDNFRYDDTKLCDFIETFKEKNLDVTAIFYGNSTLFASHLNVKKKQDRLNKYISQLYEEIINEKPVSPLQISVILDTGEDDIEPEAVQCQIEF